MLEKNIPSIETNEKDLAFKLNMTSGISSIFAILSAHAIGISFKGLDKTFWKALICWYFTIWFYLLITTIFAKPIDITSSSNTHSRDKKNKKWYMPISVGIIYIILGCLLYVLEKEVWDFFYTDLKKIVICSLGMSIALTLLVLIYTYQTSPAILEWNNFKIAKDRFYIPLLLSKVYKKLDGDEILCERICHELYTYSGKARFYKKCYYLSSTITISFPAIVVVLNNIENNKKLIISVLSSIVTIVAGFMGTMKFRESWIRNRICCEQVKSELFQYTVNSGNYSDDKLPGNMTLEYEKKALKILWLTENLENIFQKEYSEWKELREQQK